MDRYVDLWAFEYLTRDSSSLGWFYLLRGLLLIGWGMLFLIWPELLAVLVAALFVGAGILVLLIGWRVWRTKRRFEQFKRNIFL